MKPATNPLAELTAALTAVYETREAQNIAQFVLEDGLQLTQKQLRTMLLSEAQQQKLAQMTIELLHKKPWQYVVGEADFYGYKFEVTPDTLIPRVETEELVQWIIQENRLPQAKILDIGTGSGCIAISLQKNMPQTTIRGIDVSETALAIATKNNQKQATKVMFSLLDIRDESKWEGLPAFDIVVSNPPYIPPSEKKLMPDHVLEYEPELALFVAEEDPLVFYRTIANFAAKNLADKGWLYFEINEHFGAEVLELLATDQAYTKASLAEDFLGKPRMVRAQKTSK